MPTAFSIVRFSHPRQKLGDTARRQVEGSRAWCEANGYTLDESLRSRDVSAFRGKQTKVGALALALGAIQEGVIRPGSAIILESLDRLSRQNLDAAIELARDILKAGVDIVTTNPPRKYTRASLDSNYERMEMGMIFERAHEESKIKSYRIAEKWATRRGTARATGKGWGKLCPWWLAKVGDGYRIIEERAKVIRQIFEWKAAGHGAATVTKMVNGLEGIPLPSISPIWSSATVDNYLRTRTVLGEYQPHRIIEGKRVPDGDTVVGFYPAIVSLDLFHRVQASFAKSRPGRHPLDDAIINIFVGLLINGNDGLPVQLFTHSKQYKGERHIGRYLQSKGGRHCRNSDSVRIHYVAFERAFLNMVAEIDPEDFAPKDTTLHVEIAKVSGQHAEVKARIADLKAKYKTVGKGKGDILLEMILEADAERDQLADKLAVLQDEAANASTNAVSDIQALADKIKTVEPSEAKDLRVRIRSRISHLVERIIMYPELVGKNYLRHPKKLKVKVEVQFQDGSERFFVCNENGDLLDINLKGKLTEWSGREMLTLSADVPQEMPTGNFNIEVDPDDPEVFWLVPTDEPRDEEDGGLSTVIGK
jgi:DNA invertase Pin-like site-specific DNA recombinase